MAQRLKRLAAMWETWVRSLGWEDPLEKEMATHSSILKRLFAMWETWVQSLGWEDPLEQEMATHLGILAWPVPRTDEPRRLQSRIGHD